MGIKIGLGYDIHRLEKGRKLYLGGIEIPFSKGLKGHSDGDCLIHAIMDALLGAAGEKDIGEMFPPSDPKYKDIPSKNLLSPVMAKLNAQKIKVLHVDSVIIAQQPPLNSYIFPMKELLSSSLQIHTKDIGIKAKTNEGLGIIGQEEAIAAWAVVLIQKK